MTRSTDVEFVVRTIAQTAVDNEKYFGDLDSVVGDGDFGYSLARGFEIVLKRLGRVRPHRHRHVPHEDRRRDHRPHRRHVGADLGHGVPAGGLGREGQGPSSAATTSSPCSARRSRASWRAAMPNSATRRCSTRSPRSPTRSRRASLPATIPRRSSRPPLRRRAAAADATTPMIAKRGRAAYTGERSIGSPDAGAVGDRRDRRGDRLELAGRRTPATEPEPCNTEEPERTMKKIVNDPQQYVPEMLKGLASANPDTLRYVPEYNLIMRADAPRDDKVSIIQGSGSGHEPAHVMAVGPGMLDGACPGDVFAAPPMDYVYESTKLLNSAEGRAAARQQLHRRPHGVRHGAGDERGRRGERPDPLHRRRRRRAGLHVDRRPARRRGQLLRDQGGRARHPRQERISTNSCASARRSTRSPARWGSPSRRARLRRRAHRCSSSVTTRSRSAWASTASPVVGARRSCRATSSSTPARTGRRATCRSRAAIGSR